jgi:hypothetical protein
MTIAVRTIVTDTMLVAVAVFSEGEVPVVGTELSVTVAVKVCVPADVGIQFSEKGEVPPTIPMLTPLSKNCTEAMLAPAVGVAVAVIVNPAGELIDGIVDPEAGDVMEIVGVANAIGTMTAHASISKLRRIARKVFIRS